MAKKPNKEEVETYGNNYSPSSLMEKLNRVAVKAGGKAVYCALLLFYALMDEEVPMKDKAIVIGALGYFICPVDIIPDLLGPLGYSDDATVLLTAVKTIWDNITPDVKDKALNKAKEWFPSLTENEIKIK